MLTRSVARASSYPRCSRCQTTTNRSVHVSAATAMAEQVVLSKGSAEPPAGPSRQEPTFVTTFSCPYAQRSWIALNAKGIKYQPVLVDLQDKPEWFFKHNPYGRVPTLYWSEPDGTIASIYESLVVNEYVNDLAGPPLLPDDAVQRGRARLLIDQFGAKWGGPFARLMFAADAEAAAPARDELTGVLAWLESQANAAGPFLLGSQFSLVDAAIIPFFIRLHILQDLGSFTIPTADLPRLTAWYQEAMAHPAVQGSIQPPDASRSYLDQLKETYVAYIEKRKAAAAASS